MASASSRAAHVLVLRTRENPNRRGKDKHTKGLIRIRSSRINGIVYWRLVLLNGNLVLPGAAGVVVVFNIAGGDATFDGVVLLLVLVVRGGHGTCLVNFFYGLQGIRTCSSVLQWRSCVEKCFQVARELRLFECDFSSSCTRHPLTNSPLTTVEAVGQ